MYKTNWKCVFNMYLYAQELIIYKIVENMLLCVGLIEV